MCVVDDGHGHGNDSYEVPKRVKRTNNYNEINEVIYRDGQPRYS